MIRNRETASKDRRESMAQALASLTFVFAAYGIASIAVDFVDLIL